MGNTRGAIWVLTELPETLVCMGYRRLLFDRGKMLDSVVMSFHKHCSFGFQAPMHLLGECHGSSEIFYTADGHLAGFLYVSNSPVLYKGGIYTGYEH